MKGDFSRDTFDRAKHFSRVLMQQGRAQLDADWNEQAAILLHYLRTLAADVIGPFAGPAGDQRGFEIGQKGVVAESNFHIGKGRYYVDGILCENDTDNTTYTTQPDFPNPPLTKLDPGNKYLVYLDVWERHITALEDDHVREKALGGPDTASRTKVVWQVKVENVTSIGNPPSKLTSDDIRGSWDKWIARWQSSRLGCLRARVKSSEDPHDPCLTAPDSKYRGTENQLYRVEIHEGGEVGATFKWSRDNGAIVTGCELNGIELTVQNPRGFAANQWVELTNDGQDLRGELGTLVKLVKVEGSVLTFASTPVSAIAIPSGEEWPTKVRRWDQSEKGVRNFVEGAVLVKEGEWVELEDGIQIQFQPSKAKEGPNHYRTGDHWFIPARVATGDIEWPVRLNANGLPERDADNNTIPLSQPPRGIHHHYAPLAILTSNGSTWSAEECRCNFPTANGCKLPSHGEDGIGGATTCSNEKNGLAIKSASFSKRAPSLQKKSRPR